MPAILSSLVVFLVSQVAFSFPKTPDRFQTPGAVCTTQHRNFKEFRYEERIPYCRRNVSSSFKKQIYRNYGVPLHCKSLYTIDHLIPLSIGGDNSEKNLWPEHKSIKKLRKNLEFKTYNRLKSGEISQRQAINIILNAKFNPPIDDLEPDDPCRKN